MSTRMYRTYPEVVRGLGRGLLPVTGGSRVRLAAATAWHLVVYTAPLLRAAGSRRWQIALALGMAERSWWRANARPARRGRHRSHRCSRWLSFR